MIHDNEIMSEKSLDSDNSRQSLCHLYFEAVRVTRNVHISNEVTYSVVRYSKNRYFI